MSWLNHGLMMFLDLLLNPSRIYFYVDDLTQKAAIDLD